MRTNLIYLHTDGMPETPDCISASVICSETIYIEDGTAVRGNVVHISGESVKVADFMQSLLDTVGVIWTSSNPMLGNWKSIVPVPLTIPRSTWLRFKKEFKKMDSRLRLGQAAHQWFKMEKLSGKNKVWADQLYEANAATTVRMIEAVLDYSN